MNLTAKQNQMVQAAIGDGTDFPLFTDDPLVNDRIDQLVMDAPAWAKLSKEEQDLYHEEVEAARKIGSI